MKSHRASVALALFLTAGLVACQGANDGTGYGLAQPQSGSAATPASPSACSARSGAIPGTYLSLFAYGTAKGSNFEASRATGSSVWLLEKYTRQTPPPSSTPSPGPSSSPIVGVFYLYWGTFAMKNKQVGCISLLTTLNGEPLPRSKESGLASGYPNITGSYSSTTLVAKGSIRVMSITHLSAKGGYGLVVLVTSAHAPYTSGSIKLVGRTTIAADEAQRLLRDDSQSKTATRT